MAIGILDWRRIDIPLYFVIFFIVVAALDGFFVYLAVSTQTGAVTTSAYEKGLAFNQTLAQAEKIKNLGITHEFHANGRVLQWSLKKSDGQPQEGARVSARLVRSVQDGYDTAVNFTEIAPGTYEARVDPPLPGAWEIHFTALLPNQDMIASVENWYDNSEVSY